MHAVGRADHCFRPPDNEVPPVIHPLVKRGLAALALVLGIGGVGVSRSFEAAQAPLPVEASAPEVKDGDGLEVLASGPIHEAFAEPVVFDPKPGPIVTKEPPPPVEEEPP